MPRSKKEEKVETPVSDTEEPQPKKTKRRKKDKKSKSKSKKAKKVQEPQEEVSEEEEEVELEAPAPKKTKKAKKTKKEARPECAPAAAKSTSTSTSSEGGDSAEAQFSENQGKTDSLLKGLIATVQERIAADKALLASLRELNRQVTRERKEVEKVVKKLTKSQRKKRRGGNKSPGGFTKPAPLSGPMCAFLEVPDGTELPRTEVTRRVNRYVKENDLQNPENKKQILADEKLRGLLYLKDDDELTYFNLQRYMKVHFLKKDPETGSVEAFSSPVTSE